MSNLSPSADTAVDPLSMLQAGEAERSALSAYDADVSSMLMKSSKNNEPDLQDAAQLAKLAVLL